MAGRRALELSKGTRPIFAVGLAGNLWVGGRHREAAEVAAVANRGGRLNPDLLLIEAASYQLLGLERRARTVMADFLRDWPQATVTELLPRHPYRDHATAERWFEALREAGLPT